jgi:NAD(P)-dependent dehydrogenase (short-subunit alcohol dehydrogenase family)
MTFRAVVVGGTNGIGYAMACRIAASSPASSSIIVSGRSKPADLPHPNMEFRQLDASSMRGIKKYTDDLKSSGSKLDLLVMSQGIMTMQGRTETPEGIDQKMSLHFYGKQLLIRELLPVLSDAARVVIVLDGWLGDPSKLIWDDLDLKKNYSIKKAAEHCISMNDGMVQYWAKIQPEAPAAAKKHFIHAFPGTVNTNLFKGIVPSYLQGPVGLLSRISLTSPETCAERLLDGVEERVKESTEAGRFWSNIDAKGGSVKNKTIWTEEQIEKVSNHTWEIVDAALAVKD